MKLDTVTVPSFWKTEMKQRHYQIQEENSKLVVLFPGKNYPCDKPILHYAGISAIQSGFDLMVLEYGYQAGRTDLDIIDLPIVIEESKESIHRIINKYDQVIFISKSIGTIVAGEVHQKLGIPIKHIYLTPIKGTIDYINKSDGLVIYGTKDEVFNKELESQIIVTNNRRVIEIPNANHALETKDVIESVEILSSLVRIYMDFLSGK
ncbi:alpha/beta hydrolase [Paenibacillus guangzhouensis]|uniref:alpha/beta hydrolase n=1 Tax=Paenibacillus guangzhouensis TaxID=1473112 RepID=UPI0012669907|nr:alpha/beta hydrolase [Paenibacillus guangzhouensis]